MAVARNYFGCTLFSLLIIEIYLWINRFDGVFATGGLVLILNTILYLWLKKCPKRDTEFQSKYFLVSSIRLIGLLFIFNYGWLPTLETGNAWIGYDPIRYYYQAIGIVNGEITIQQIGLNYMGIIYWYAVLFKIFGQNPIVPILVNNFLTIVSSRLIHNIIRVASRETGTSARLNRFSLYLIPELFWYDVLSSRETLCLTLFLIAVLCIYETLVVSKENINIFISLLCVILLGIVRMSLVLPVGCIVLLTVIFQRKTSIGKRMVIFVLVAFCILLVPVFSTMLGSANSSFEGILSTLNYVSDDYTWSNNSIGKLLVADSLIERIILAPVRMIVYLITPLPNIRIDFAGILEGTYSSWQNLFVLLSSVFYVYKMNEIISAVIGLIYGSYGKKYVLKFLTMSFMVSLATAACGTQIIHERYRIFVIPWILLAVYSGSNTGRSTRKMSRIIMAMLCVMAVGVYFIIKAF